MKAAWATLWLLSVRSVAGATVNDATNPITRVVGMLREFKDDIEKEGKREEDMMMKFKCWATGNIKRKTESNEAANSRIDELASYISDVENGRVEFSSERVDLEKTIATLTDELETSKTMREKEQSDFVAAEAEMNTAITALEDAIDVLVQATKDHQDEESLISLRGASGLAEHNEQVAALSKAVELGQRVLSKGDALFLRELLIGGDDKPNKDWKKLNKDSEFKKTYKARSGGIQDYLTKLLITFKNNLKTAQRDNAQAIADYTKLSDNKKDQLDSAKQALGDASVETGMRQEAVDKSKEEKTALEDQVSDDTKYINDMQSDLDEKIDEYKKRKQLRTEELAGVSEAISILRSDDARDLFAKSMSSQGYLFLQRGKIDAMDEAIQKVVDDIKSQIDKLYAEMEDNQSDLDGLNKRRMENTREAQKLSRSVDSDTDNINSLTALIAKKTAEIKQARADKAAAQQAIKDLEKMRAEQNAEFLSNKQDDQAAADLVGQAKDALEKFYKKNGKFFFIQVSQFQEQPVDERLNTPPATWDGSKDYGGKKSGSQGIVGMLEIIANDINEDIKEAEREEKASKKAADKQKADLETLIGELNTMIDDAKKVKSDSESEKGEATAQRSASSDTLEQLMGQIKDEELEGTFLATNIETMTKNTEIEIDGLKKGKLVLEGGLLKNSKD